MNITIQVLANTGGKWIVDLGPIKVQLGLHICVHENTWPRKVSWDPWQWTRHDHYVRQGSKAIPFFQFMNKLVRHILVAQTNKGLVAAKIWHTYHVPHTTIAKFWHQLW